MPLTPDQLLSRVSPGLRKPARQILRHLLAADATAEDLSAYGMLHFVWYTLPVAWSLDDEAREKATEAAARVMLAAGHPLVAEIIRAPATATIQAAWANDRDQAIRLYERAMAESGYRPPDTDVLAWGHVMGPTEAGVRSTLAGQLQQAIDNGRLRPGGDKWRRKQANLVKAWLTTPGPDGRTPVDEIHAERRDAWLRGLTPTHRTILAPLLPLMDRRIVIPDDGAAPLRWLLERIDDGVSLTMDGHLPAPMVREAKRLWYADWPRAETAARDPADLLPLHILWEFAHARKILTRNGAWLTVSKIGKAALTDKSTWWSTVTGAWFGGTLVDTYVAELAAAMMLRAASTEEIIATAMKVVAPRFSRRDGSAADQTDIEYALHEWLPIGQSLGFIKPGQADSVRVLTKSGRSAVLYGLRHRSQAPLARS